jgi:hypothetical protein
LPSTDPLLEAARGAARRAVANASLRLVAKEVGISHTALSAAIAEPAVTDVYGSTRAKLVAWAERQETKAGGASAAMAESLRAEGFREGVRFTVAAISRFSTGLLRSSLGPKMPTAEQLEELVAEEEILRRVVLPPKAAAEEPRRRKKRA